MYTSRARWPCRVTGNSHSFIFQTELGNKYKSIASPCPSQCCCQVNKKKRRLGNKEVGKNLNKQLQCEPTPRQAPIPPCHAQGHRLRSQAAATQVLCKSHPTRQHIWILGKPLIPEAHKDLHSKKTKTKPNKKKPVRSLRALYGLFL